MNDSGLINHESSSWKSRSKHTYLPTLFFKKCDKILIYDIFCLFLSQILRRYSPKIVAKRMAALIFANLRNPGQFALLFYLDWLICRDFYLYLRRLNQEQWHWHVDDLQYCEAVYQMGWRQRTASSTTGTTFTGGTIRGEFHLRWAIRRGRRNAVFYASNVSKHQKGCYQRHKHKLNVSFQEHQGKCRRIGL